MAVVIEFGFRIYSVFTHMASIYANLLKQKKAFA